MRRHPLDPLLAAALCLGGLALTGAISLILPAAQVRDNATLHGFTAFGHTRLAGVAGELARTVDPRPYVVIAVVLALIAAARRRLRLAVLVPLAMGGAAATSELLKPLIAQPRFSEWLGASGRILSASWPSGHATAAMMVALCAVLVAPRVLRPLVALLGSCLAVGVSYSILVLGWHFPSDVLGGFLVAGLWTATALAVLWWADARWPSHSARAAVSRARGALAPASLLVLAAGGGISVLALRGHVAQTYAASHLSFLAGAAAIALLPALLATALVAALSDRPAARAARSRVQRPAPG
ncbi:MAG: hypothetical protein NVSMB51_03470 [Solirubrobacteraceae bacterium]